MPIITKSLPEFEVSCMDCGGTGNEFDLDSQQVAKCPSCRGFGVKLTADALTILRLVNKYAGRSLNELPPEAYMGVHLGT